MKKILAILCLVAFTATVYAQAPQYAWTTVVGGGTATCAATAGTNVAKIIDCRKQSSIPLQIELMADAAGAYTFTVPIQYSVDGSTWAGMNSGSIAISFNGVTKQTAVTNVNTYGCGFIKIPYLTNATASIAVSNIVIKAGLKTSAP